MALIPAVSTSTAVTRVFTHTRQVAPPEARAGQFQNLASLDAPHHLPQRAVHRPRVRSLAAQSSRFLEQLTINHKIRTFHTD